VRERILGKCRKSIFAKSKTSYKQLKWWEVGMKPYFGQRITSVFARVSTSQNINTENYKKKAPGSYERPAKEEGP
jgi:hypothetical protein